MKWYVHPKVRKPGRRIYGGIPSRYEKDFCHCYQNYLRRLWLKFFNFQMSGFRGILKGGVHPLKSWGDFSDILATASSINTLYGLETWYVQSSRHIGITQKVLRHIRNFWRIYDVTNVGCFRHFQFLSTARIIKSVVTLDFHKEYVFW